MMILLVALVVVTSAVAVARNIYPYSKFEIWALHLIHSRGSGWDDAATGIVSSHPQRYAPQIQRMLMHADAGSNDEVIALEFVEFVLEQPGTRDMLRKRAEHHPDGRTADLITAILDSPPKTYTIS